MEYTSFQIGQQKEAHVLFGVFGARQVVDDHLDHEVRLQFAFIGDLVDLLFVNRNRH